ncbi:hypothetical protein [Variovorax paradoxus]|uniref:hypothetical protein n=1 Tax=Variovorax paradoxus TaxID=34073 RepID=UPI001931CAE3|nr:hypothetical protein INQ48_18185 [Variovorax paradoxus]
MKPYPNVATETDFPPLQSRPHEPESGAARFVSLGLLALSLILLGVWAWRSF